MLASSPWNDIDLAPMEPTDEILFLLILYNLPEFERKPRDKCQCCGKLMKIIEVHTHEQFPWCQSQQHLV